MGLETELKRIADYSEQALPLLEKIVEFISRETETPEPLKAEPVKRKPAKKSAPKSSQVKEEPVKEEPVKEEPVKEEPVKEEPVKEEPVKTFTQESIRKVATQYKQELMDAGAESSAAFSEVKKLFVEVADEVGFEHSGKVLITDMDQNLLDAVGVKLHSILGS